jgi:surface polysaccharide O-acyltransferase-like enzyme
MKTEMPTPLSNHLRLVGFVSAIMVVYIHSTTIKYGNGVDTHAVAAIEFLLSHVLFHVSLAVFFSTSAYLLFSEAMTQTEMVPRVRRRAVSLLLPYVSWAAIWWAVTLTFGHYAHALAERADIPWFDALFLQPIPGHLWFLRDLILLVGLSPLLLAMPRRFLIAGACAALCWWLWIETPTVLKERNHWYECVSNESLAWFLLGAVAAREFTSDRIASWLGKPRPWLLALSLSGWLLLPIVPVSAPLLEHLARLFGTAALFLALPWMKRLAASDFLGRLSTYSFLIYLAHHPLIGLVLAVAIRYAASNPWWHLGVYVAVPALLIAAIISVSELLRATLPGVVYVFNGGRKLAPLRAHA